MLISRDAVYRTLIGMTLKSVGITARILDIPSSAPDLKKQAMRRELVDLGIIGGASLAMEAIIAKANVPSKIQHFVKFVPLFVAYVFAEWVSRQVTSYNKVLDNSVSGSPASLPLPKTPLLLERRLGSNDSFSTFQKARQNPYNATI